jgi:hypothetical protein
MAAEYGTYGWLREEVGRYLGLDPDPDNWSESKSAQVDSIIRSADMQRLYPPPMQAGEEPQPPHQWSFLSPVHGITVRSGESTYDLPEDFSGVVGDFVIEA